MPELRTLNIGGTSYDIAAGGVPTGTVIHYAGLTAPSGYLACDGTVYNISAYPDLATFFETNYGSKNYWGGDGTATFAVPDWRGEFFRASGTQSRSGQGSGAAVGVHQDATSIPQGWVSEDNYNIRYYFPTKSGSNFNRSMVRNVDADDGKTNGAFIFGTSVDKETATSGSGTNSIDPRVRPTNTSLLVCIKT